jgi:hypothetical protein
LRVVVGAARRRVRRDGAWAAAAAVALAIPLVLLLAWVLGDGESWAPPSPAPLALELIALGLAAAAGAWLVGRWIGAYDEGRAAASAEETLGLPDGSVRGVLELGRTVPDGTSPALFRLAEERMAQRVAGVPPATLAGQAGQHARRRVWRAGLVLAGVTAGVLALGFATPARTRAAWAPLAHPVSNLKSPPMPALEVRPGNARVARGGSLDLRIRAPLRRWVQVHWRTPGEVPRTRDLDVNSDAARTRLGAIDGPTSYWVTAPDGATTDTFRITPVDPLLLSDLVLEISYPAYLARGPERYDGDVPALDLPAGAELRIRGRGTRVLSAAQLVERASGRRIYLYTEADRFTGSWTPTASGTYDWALADRAGGGLASAPAPLTLTILPDSAPRVEVVVPSMDTTLSGDLHEPVAANAWDDHGLRAAALVSWRVSSTAQQSAPVEQALSLGGVTDRATLQAVLDATSRGLLPGDTLRFFIRVTDNSPAHQTGVSRTISLRLPDMDELRQLAQREAEGLLSDASSLARDAQGLQEETRNLGRETAADNARNAAGHGGSPDNGAGNGSLSYERSEQARKVLDKQNDMVQQVQDLEERTARLEKAMKGAGLQDPELQARLQELKQLYDQILTPEMRQKLEALSQALAKQDPQAVQKALDDLAKQQEEFKKQLDQSLDVMRRAAAEQQMTALAEKARDLATQEKALGQAMQQQKNDSTSTRERQDLANQQKQLAARVDSLSKAVDSMRQRLQQQGESQAAKQTGQASKQTAQAQQQAEEAAHKAGQDPNQAGRQAQEAADSLTAAAQTLDQTRQQMASGWKQETQQALQQATNEALELAQRQASIAKRMGNMKQDSDQQSPTPQQMMNQQQQSGGQQQDGQQSSSGSQQGLQPPQAGGQQQGAQSGGKNNPRPGGAKEGGQQGQGQQGQGGKSGGKMAAGPSQPNGQGSLQALKAEQQTLQQSLQQLGQNLSDAGQKSALMNKDVGNALARAMLAMQQTMRAMNQQGAEHDPPTEQAEQAVDALNRLALALATNGQQVGGSESGTGVPQALQQLSDLAQKQSAVNGRTSALVPLDLAPSALTQQMQGLAQQQRAIAQKLTGMANRGGQDQVLGKLDELSRQADQIARDMSGGRITEDLMRRQQELFHRLLDAGRTLEKDEFSSQRVAESPGDVGAVFGKALDPALVRLPFRYAVPTPEQLQALPPAYRRLILEYFDRLNRTAAADSMAGNAAAAAGDSTGKRP